MRWHLVTGEYPPGCGGVGDYSSLLASALRGAGDEVEVWTRRGDQSPGTHVLPDDFGAGTRAMLGHAWRERPGVVLLQYVPQALGRGGTNLSFCRWLRTVNDAGADVRVMFHEPYTYFSLRPWQCLQAIAQRAMVAILLRASRHTYASTTTWERYLSPYGPVASLRVLPIPSTIPQEIPPSIASEMSVRVRGGAPFVVGHFGTYGEHVSAELLKVLARLELPVGARVACIGEGSERFVGVLAARAPRLAPAAVALGRLGPAEASAALRACDVLLQPYPDGVTTRRTSMMAGLANGRAVVTTDGLLTEAIWRDARPAALYPVANPAAGAERITELLASREERRGQEARACDTYDRFFSMAHTLRELRESGQPPVRAGVA